MTEKSRVAGLKLQNRTIKKQLKAPRIVGKTWYMIASEWARKFILFTEGDISNGKPVGHVTNDPGPIVNQSLFLDGTSVLRPQLMENIDFTFVPEDAWSNLVQWYSLAEGQEPVARNVIDQGIFNQNCNIEVYLVDLKLCQNDNFDVCFTEHFSRTATIDEVEKVMRRLFNIVDDKDVKLWCKYTTNTYIELKNSSNTLVDANLYSGHVVVIEEKNSNGTWPRATTDESIGSNIPGRCGLENLGNSCFLNSILQCLCQVPSLIEYLTGGRWIEDLNLDNPLGTKGELATCFADLVVQIWTGMHKDLAPVALKAAVGRFKPEFSSTTEQDSQELMAFLLDGLHEDLNRVRKKPYIETKEADNRPDEEVAAEAWIDHLLRNNSVIVDNFHGQLKSTLVCPKCSKVSVKFDPFCYLSLPLPVKKERQMTITFVPVNSKLKIRQFNISVPEMGTIYDLQRMVATLTGAKMEQLVVVDVADHLFLTFYQPTDMLADVTDDDRLFTYEIPVSSSADPDTVIVPVYMRETRSDPGCSQLFGSPLFVPFPRNTCTFEIMYSTVLDRMDQFVKRPNDRNRNSSTDLDSKDESFDSSVESGSHTDDMDVKEDEESDDVSQVDAEANETSMQSSPLVEKNCRIFSLQFVSWDGSVDLDEVIDDGKPVTFASSSYLAADWSSEARALYYKATEAEEPDECVKQNPTMKTIQMKDCLDLFMAEEKLGSDSKWNCPVCKKHQQATKKLQIWNLPNTLVMHLKRFAFKETRTEKIDTLVSFPVRDFDMSPFVINPSHKPSVYNLIAVSNHSEVLGVRHYTALTRNKDTNEWFNFDDLIVSRTSEESVVTKAGYVLVYQLQTDLQI